MVRRAFYYWQFPAAVILPTWLLIGWAIFAASGWELLGIIFFAGMLTVGMLVTAGLILARKGVREQRAVSWIDVGLLAVLHGLIIANGFYTSATGLLSVLAVVALIALFWSGIIQLVLETRRRVRQAFASYEEQASRLTGRPRSPRADGEYIVIETSQPQAPPRV
ncbi:hypothetical protein B5808_06070 [Cnuibacter physcomitrellae]|uniref:MFS transporter n=1 Tax=Cnuibacter physcomitrellae TaxID=1619308 RepID=A0A1X9LI32_9MICO|nr:hypothetical protein B5808_06070 [Cnuibacter physcomitrellae]